MIAIGITGGVGSGKSSVLYYIKEKYNVKLIITDILAKTIMQSDFEIIDKLNEEFINDDVFDEYGNFITSKLSALLFSNEDKRLKLNSIVHPAVKEYVLKQIDDEDNKKNYSAIFIESALLLEEEYDKIFDCIYIFANQDVRIKRLYESRGYSKEKSLDIINSQLSEDVYKKRCKHIIDNSSDFNSTIEQIDNILINEYMLSKE